MLINGVGDVDKFGTGRPGIFYHRVQHLCRYDYRFLGLYTFFNQSSLYAGDFFLGNFYSQIASRDHYPISGFEYLVDIIHTLLILYFGDNLDRAFVLVEYSLYIENILFAAYERVSDEVDILFNGIVDIANVFFCERR